jgi:hypothetical protein
MTTERLRLHRVCPWWLGYVLASPVRRMFHHPAQVLAGRVRASKLGARLLLVEPAGHVTASLFDAELRAAREAGFTLVESPSVRRSRTALLEKIRAATAL